MAEVNLKGKFNVQLKKRNRIEWYIKRRADGSAWSHDALRRFNDTPIPKISLNVH